MDGTTSRGECKSGGIKFTWEIAEELKDEMKEQARLRRDSILGDSLMSAFWGRYGARLSDRMFWLSGITS